MNNIIIAPPPDIEDDVGVRGWRLRDDAVHSVPPLVPVDRRCSRRVRLDVWGADGGEGERSVGEISLRLSSACRALSLHGIWDDRKPTVTLSSMERVEMEISVYRDEDAFQVAASPSSVLLVEVMRLKGCPVAFHNYRRHLLDAANGKFDPQRFKEADGLDKPSGRDRCNQPRATLGRPSLSRPATITRPGSIASPSVSRPSVISRPSPMGGLNRLNPTRPDGIARPPPSGARVPSGALAASPRASPAPLGPGVSGGETTRSEAGQRCTLEALTEAASLLRKDRFDARRHGIESLALLTDQFRAGAETARIAGLVVLLGTARPIGADSEVKEDEEDEGDVDSLFDDETSGLGIREAILEMISKDHGEDSDSESDSEGFRTVEREFADELFNLCLTVLSNALRAVGGRAAGALPVPRLFLDRALDDLGVDVLPPLFRVLSRAGTCPHDACRSARCLGAILGGCGDAHAARARGDLDAKGALGAALGVGRACHAGLADACGKALLALGDDDDGDDGAEYGGMP